MSYFERSVDSRVLRMLCVALVVVPCFCMPVVMAGELVLRSSVEIENAWSCQLEELDSQDSYGLRNSGFSLDSNCGKFSYAVFGEYEGVDIPFTDSVMFGAEAGYYSGAAWGSSGMFGGRRSANGETTADDYEDNMYYGLKLGASLLDSRLRPYLHGGIHNINNDQASKDNILDWKDRLNGNVFYGVGVEYRSSGFVLRGGWDRLEWGDAEVPGIYNAYDTEDYYGFSVIYRHEEKP